MAVSSRARIGLFALPPLIAAGTGSVLYWHATEQVGRGDLRPYVLAQLLPLVAIPLTKFPGTLSLTILQSRQE